MNEYEILEEELGCGTFGKVFKAKNTNGENFAIKRIKKSVGRKFIKPSIQQPNHELVIKREIAVLKKLNHLNCIKLIDALEDETFWFLVFKEYLPIDSLERDLRLIFNDVLLGLEYIHAHDIVHLDLKPDNLLFDGERIILCDFGLSELMTNSEENSSGSSTSSTWTKQGTPGFTAPENLKSGDLINLPEFEKAKKADMWGFGMTMYYFEYHSLPYEDLNFIDKIEALCSAEIELKNKSDISFIVRGLLNRDMLDRYDVDTCRTEINKLKEWPTILPKNENLKMICSVTKSEIDLAFKKVHFMATVLKAVTRFKRGSKSSMDMAKELDKIGRAADSNLLNEEMVLEPIQLKESIEKNSTTSK